MHGHETHTKDANLATTFLRISPFNQGGREGGRERDRGGEGVR
jgi:hypothetical protein